MCASSYLLFDGKLYAEQQGKLKDIYARFKNEVNVHLQDCKSTLEGLELQQTEFKDIIEEQSMATSLIVVYLK